MLPQIPRWLLLGLLLSTGIALVVLFKSQRLDVPPDCTQGDSAMKAGDYNLAINHYLQCLEAGDLAPALQARVFFALGNADSAKEDYYQAIEDYSEVLQLDPSQGWAYNNRCWSRGMLRQSTEALRDCDEAMKRLPDQPAVLDSRALAYWQLGQLDKARADLTRAHQLDASFPTADGRIREFEKMFE